jgi:hypothetical protein
MDNNSLFQDILKQEIRVARIGLYTPTFTIQDTKEIARQYSRPLLKPKVFLPSKLAHWSRCVASIVIALMFAMMSSMSISVDSIRIPILFFLWVIYSAIALAVMRYIYPYTGISLTISNIGIHWGETLYKWSDIKSTIIVERTFIWSNWNKGYNGYNVYAGSKYYQQHALHITREHQDRVRLSLDSIIGISTLPSDIASAIEHFRHQYETQQNSL